MTDELPPVHFLDAAARLSGWLHWLDAEIMLEGSNHKCSIIAHARTLHQLAKYERPPVDPAELKRRQDAREYAAQAYDRTGATGASKRLRNGEHDENLFVYALYEYACHRDNVTPVPVEEWGK